MFIADIERGKCKSNLLYFRFAESTKSLYLLLARAEYITSTLLCWRNNYPVD